jgi:signal transduction histidine kinase/CheY-like chemotaxis protein
VKTRREPVVAKRSAAAPRRRKTAAKGTKAAAVSGATRKAKGERIVASPLGWWALDDAPTPYALIDRKRISRANPCFDQLARRNATVSWKRLDPELGKTVRPCRGLARLLVSEAATLGGMPPRAPVTRLYQRVGREQYLEASYWYSPEKREQQTVVMIREVTARVHADHELARMREALLQNERMRAIGELASGIAHDLNNTLHAMNLRLSLIEQSDVCRSAQESNIAALSRAVNDAALVVGRLQDFARQKGDRSLDAVDVSAVVKEAIEMVRTTIEGESSLAGTPVRIRTRLPSFLPAVTALPSEVRHVAVNLLLNARDAMPKGGTIEIVGEARGERVILKVLDEGGGIPDKDLENIFSPFFTTKGKRGTGLGLSNARAVLGRVGAEISARNRQGGGACFTLSFPIATLRRSAVPERRGGVAPRGRRILLVDDNLDNLQATKMVMELQEQSVDIAQSGSEVIARLLAGSRYDLVFCDLGMPDMCGWRIAEEIQTLAPGTAVYMLTGWSQHVQTNDPRRQWVKGVLQKPMKPEMMQDLLAEENLPVAPR